MLKKHMPSGKVKIKAEQEKFCNTCRNGELFEAETYVKKGAFAPNIVERICGVCNTKYFLPYTKDSKTVMPWWIEVSKESKIAPDGVVIELSEEMDTVNEEIILGREVFMLTGSCPEHRIVESNTVKTAEGNFKFYSCIICGQGAVNYRGEKKTGKLMDLVNMIASNGIEAAKNPFVGLVEEEDKNPFKELV